MNKYSFNLKIMVCLITICIFFIIDIIVGVAYILYNKINKIWIINYPYLLLSLKEMKTTRYRV